MTDHYNVFIVGWGRLAAKPCCALATATVHSSSNIAIILFIIVLIFYFVVFVSVTLIVTLIIVFLISLILGFYPKPQ